MIFANEFFEIRRSLNTGWGAFALKELHEGDQILVEKALYYSIHENVEKSVRGLSEMERAIANDMYAYYSRDGETLEEAIWSTNSWVVLVVLMASETPKLTRHLGSSPVSRSNLTQMVSPSTAQDSLKT